MKNNKGITLIALVITIIVLLILAGVSIAMLTGQNGILTRANDSQIATTDAEVIEKVNMELNAQLTNALAGRDFDTGVTLDLPDGYSATVTPSNITSDWKVLTDGSKIQSDEGSVKYESGWKMTPLTYAS